MNATDAKQEYDRHVTEIISALENGLEYSSDEPEEKLSRIGTLDHMIRSHTEMLCESVTLDQCNAAVSALPPKFARVSVQELDEYLNRSEKPYQNRKRRGPMYDGDKLFTIEDFELAGEFTGSLTMFEHYGVLRETDRAICIALEPPYATEQNGYSIEAAWIPKKLIQYADSDEIELAEFFEVTPIQYEER